jgi:hypothetical protein
MTRSGNVYDLANNLKPSGCAEYYRTLQQRSWMKAGIQLNSATHGHLHELMGGSFGFQKAIKSAPYSTKAHASYDGMHQFQHITEAASKILWRYNYITCPTYGSSSTCPYEKSIKVKSVDDLKLKSDGCLCTCTADMYSSSFTKILFDLGKSS